MAFRVWNICFVNRNNSGSENCKWWNFGSVWLVYPFWKNIIKIYFNRNTMNILWIYCKDQLVFKFWKCYSIEINFINYCIRVQFKQCKVWKPKVLTKESPLQGCVLDSGLKVALTKHMSNLVVMHYKIWKQQWVIYTIF